MVDHLASAFLECNAEVRELRRTNGIELNRSLCRQGVLCVPAKVPYSKRQSPANQTLVDTKFIWPFVASLAKDLRQDTSTMLRQNIHREISKAIQRLIVLWEVRTSLSLHQEGEEAKKVLGICPGICPLRDNQRRGASKHRA